MSQRSLTQRVIAGVLLAELLCAVTFSVVALEHEMHSRRRAFDVMLQGRADSLLGSVQDVDDPEANVSVDPSELVLPKEDVYVVVSPSGRLIGQSANVTAALLSRLKASATDGYFDFKAGEHAGYRGLRTQGVRVIDRLENGGVRRPVTLLYAAPDDHLEHEAVEAARFYALTSVILLAITGLLLVWLLERWLAPLHQLALSASRVSVRSWEFEPSAAAMATRELRPIAVSIKQLLGGLQLSFEQQRRFIGDAAHELKTSIAVFKSSVQLLTMRRRSVEEYEHEAGRLLLDIGRMESISQRMLTLACLEEREPGSTAVTDLAKLVHEVVAQIRPVAEVRRIAICVKAETTSATIPLADAELLCSNLLLNAIEHSGDGSNVEVSVSSEDLFAVLTVTDQGEGIPSEALPHVFERFYRVDSSRSRESGGAGLGLAICKAIVTASKGTIVLESTLKVGTTAIVRLPLAQDRDASSSSAGSRPPA